MLLACAYGIAEKRRGFVTETLRGPLQNPYGFGATAVRRETENKQPTTNNRHKLARSACSLCGTGEIAESCRIAGATFSRRHRLQWSGVVPLKNRRKRGPDVSRTRRPSHKHP